MWAVWWQQRRFYPDWPIWWGRYTKTDLSFLYSGRVRTSAGLREDITIFVTTPTDVPVTSDAIQCYEKATGACLKTRKSKVLVVGGWSTYTDTLNIP